MKNVLYHLRNIKKYNLFQKKLFCKYSTFDKKILKKPEPPREPSPEECCGNGCQTCVWTIYFEEDVEYREKLEEFEKQQKELNKENEEKSTK